MLSGVERARYDPLVFCFLYRLPTRRSAARPHIATRPSLPVIARVVQHGFGGPTGQGVRQNLFRDAKAPVFRFFVPFVAFCRLFKTAGGRISTEANKGNEELRPG